MNKQRLQDIKEQLENTAIIGELYLKGDPWKGYEVIDEHNGMTIGKFSNGTEAKLMADAPKLISELVNEVERLREALEFYADEKHYETDIMLEDNPCDVTEDGGLIARKALKGDKQ